MEPEREPEGGRIPKSLHSVYSGGPFRECVDCGTPLLEVAVPYAVEKVVRQEEVVLEYAVCAACMAAMFREYSQESIENIRQYLEQEGEDLMGGGPENRCHRCGIAGNPFDDEHTLTAMLVGSQVVVGVSALCGKCQEGMEGLLSQKTRDVHGDFMNRNFPGVPDSLELPVGFLSA